MQKQGSGSIINNGSIAGTRAGYSSSTTYSAAKAAVIQRTKVVAMELGESNVRVNSISPGAIATGILAKALGLSIAEAERSVDIILEAYNKWQPQPLADLPKHIPPAPPFLATSQSNFT